MAHNASFPPLPLYARHLSVDRAYMLIGDFFALLSLCGSIIIIFCYSVFKGIRTTSRLLLVMLSVANTFTFASTLWQSTTYYQSLAFPSENSFTCQASAGLWVLSQVCTALWVVAITFYLFMCVTLRCIIVANRIVILFHLFCWVMPMVVSLSADISGVYGYDSTDIMTYGHPTPCWISDRVANPLPWYLITVEGWVMAAYVIGSLLYFPILWSTMRHKYKGKEVVGDDVIEELGIMTANEQLRFIPVIYVCTRIWGTMYFLFTRYPDDRHLRGYDWLLIIKAIGDNSQGLVNAIFFCTATKQIRKLVSGKIRRCCSCFCGWCDRQRIIGGERWMRVPTIVRARATLQRKRTLDGSDLDISGISLDLPETDTLDDIDITHAEEDEILFER